MEYSNKFLNELPFEVTLHPLCLSICLSLSVCVCVLKIAYEITGSGHDTIDLYSPEEYVALLAPPVDIPDLGVLTLENFANNPVVMLPMLFLFFLFVGFAYHAKKVDGDMDRRTIAMLRDKLLSRHGKTSAVMQVILNNHIQLNLNHK